MTTEGVVLPLSPPTSPFMTNRSSGQYHGVPGWTYAQDTNRMPYSQWRSGDGHLFGKTGEIQPLSTVGGPTTEATSQGYGELPGRYQPVDAHNISMARYQANIYPSLRPAVQSSERLTAPEHLLRPASNRLASDASARRLTWHSEADEPGDLQRHAEESTLSDTEHERATGRPSLTVAELRAHNRRLKRFRLTHSQTRYLMSEFAKQPRPDAAHRERLSREIPGFSPRQVQVWFQNRRAKLKRFTNDDRELMTRARVLPPNFDMTPVLHATLSHTNLTMPISSSSYLAMQADDALTSRPSPLNPSQQNRIEETHTPRVDQSTTTDHESSHPARQESIPHSGTSSGIKHAYYDPLTAQPSSEQFFIQSQRTPIQRSPAEMINMATDSGHSWSHAPFDEPQRRFMNSAAEMFALQTAVSPEDRRDSRLAMPLIVYDYAAAQAERAYDGAFQNSERMEHQQYPSTSTQTTDQRMREQGQQRVNHLPQTGYHTAMGRFGPFVPP